MHGEGRAASAEPPPASAAARPDRIGPRVAAIVLALLYAVLVARIALLYGVLSATIDEGRHVAAGVELYQTRAFSVYYHSPPLPRYLNGLLPYLAGARVPEAGDEAKYARFLEDARGHRESAIGKFVLEGSPDYWRTLTLARIGTLAFLALLMGYAYRWASLLWGRVSGLAAAALLSLSPNFIGHGALATVDVAFAATFFAATYHLWRWCVMPRTRTCVAAAVACAVATLAKYPAPLFLAAVFAAYFLLARWRALGDRRQWSLAAVRTAAGRALLFFAVAFVVVWAGYQFSVGIAAERMAWLDRFIDYRFAEGSLPYRFLHWVGARVPIPMPEFFDGAYDLANEASRGWTAYLLGESRQGGYWLYFPIAIAVKSTPGMLLLGAAGIALLAVHHRQPWAAGSAYLVAAMLLYLLLLMAKKMNIGIRHALPVYPFLAVLGSSVLARSGPPERARRWLAGLGAALLLWHAGESFAAHPDYLSYFNGIARGREEHFLRDSNLDWGQDLARLGRYLDEHGIDEVTLSVFGARFGTSPGALGIENATLLDAAARPHGWFAVSINHLGGIGLSGDEWAALDGFSWLEGHEPRARIGKSIRLYELP